MKKLEFKNVNVNESKLIEALTKGMNESQKNVFLSKNVNDFGTMLDKEFTLTGNLKICEFSGNKYVAFETKEGGTISVNQLIQFNGISNHITDENQPVKNEFFLNGKKQSEVKFTKYAQGVNSKNLLNSAYISETRNLATFIALLENNQKMLINAKVRKIATLVSQYTSKKNAKYNGQTVKIGYNRVIETPVYNLEIQ